MNLEEINSQFNKNLIAYFKKQFVGSKDFHFSLGYPSKLLLKFGCPARPIILRTDILAQKVKLHNLNIYHLIDLPVCINKPLMIFKYDKIEGAFNIFIEDRNDEGILVVGIHTDNREVNGLFVDEIRTIHGRNINQIIKEVDNGNCLFYNKEKLASFFKPQINSGNIDERHELLLTKLQNYFPQSQAKRKKTFLGATEILSQNGESLDYKGFQPTYKILPSYDHLIEKVPYKTLFTDEGGTELTLKIIGQLTKQYSKEVKRLASHLFDRDLTQSCFNIWHFIKHNIKYAFDAEGIEQLRTPGRSWAERFTGVDCDDMAMFAACCLIEMGYKPQYYVVNFNYKPEPGHIYTVINGIVVDGVMNKFNTHPDFITKTMKIEALNGIALAGIGHPGLGAIHAEIMNAAKNISSAMQQTNNPATLQALQNANSKLAFAIGIEEPEHAPMIGMLKYARFVDPKGRIIFNHQKINRLLYGDGSINGIGEQSDDYILNQMNGFTDEEFDTLEGLCNIAMAVDPETDDEDLSGLGDLGKGWLKKAFKKVGQGIKKVGKGIVKAAKKVVKVIARFNPVTASMRGAILIALKKNVGGWAKKLKYGLYSQAQAQQKKLDMNQWKKHVDTYKSAVKWFEQFGGKEDKFRAAISKGSGGLSGTNEIDNHMSNLAGFGFIADIAQAVKSIFNFLTKLFTKKGANTTAMLKDADPSEIDAYKNAAEGNESDVIKETDSELKKLSTNFTEGQQTQEKTTESNTSGKSNTTLFLLLGVAGVAAIAMLGGKH